LKKEITPKITKITISFDFGKSIEKIRYNQLQRSPYGILIVDLDKKRTLDYSKLIEICGRESDDGAMIIFMRLPLH
jgi:hypothetical protein